MKKFILIILAAIFAATPAARAVNRGDCVKEFQTCEAILREFMANPDYAIPPVVLQYARAIVITNQYEGGFIVAVNGGFGVMMVKRADNTWSVPVLIHVGGASIGFQIGGKNSESILVFTNDQTPRLVFNTRFNIGVDAKAVAGPKYAEAQAMNRAILTTPILVYMKSRGLMAGATVKTGWISRNDKANSIFYRTKYVMPELLYGNFVTAQPEVQPLMSFIQQIAP